MTLQEALKSGKPFKRKNCKDYYLIYEDLDLVELTKEEILAEDWIVKQEPRVIQFEAEFLDSRGHLAIRECSQETSFILLDGKRFHVVATEIME